MGNARHIPTKAGPLSVLILLLAVPTAAADCASPSTIVVEETARPFTQNRFLSGIERPIVSRGLLVVQEGAVTWQVCEPFDIRTVIDRDGARQSIEGGPIEPIGPGAARDMFQRAGVPALLQGDFAALVERYAVEGLDAPIADGPWHVRLVPQDPLVARVIDAVQVTGCKRVDSISILRPDAERDEIVLGEAISIPSQDDRCRALN